MKKNIQPTFLRLIFPALVFLLINNYSFAQIGGLGGHWTVDCGVEYHPEMNANFICAICEDFKDSNREVAQFHFNFVGDSLFIPENYKRKKKCFFRYTYNLKTQILKFNYFGRDYVFKVIKAGNAFLFVTESTNAVLLLRRE